MTFRSLKLWSYRKGADFGDWCHPPRGNGEPKRAARGFRSIIGRKVRKQEKRAVGREVEADLGVVR